jgi:hypothetical protein
MAQIDPKQQRRRDELTTAAERALAGKPVPYPSKLVEFMKKETRKRLNMTEAKAVVERLRRRMSKAAKKEEPKPVEAPKPAAPVVSAPMRYRQSNG